MSIPSDKYCGDEIMDELLKRAKSKLTIFEVYGLFYGCIAATNMVNPSQYIPMIFGSNEISAETMEKAEEIFSNLMFLWNTLAQWEPETDSFILPDVAYHDSYSGLKECARNNSSLMKYFIKGLDIGETDESDFSEEGLESLNSLSGVDAFFLKYAKLFEKENGEENKDFEKTSNSIVRLEKAMADCIARINLGLKEARIRAVEEMRKPAISAEKAYQSRSSKISRNNPCPCGSGKKYKKCCGQIH